MLISVTEGEDKPLKYPTIFQHRRPRHHHQNGSRRAVEFDRELAERNIHTVAPEMPILYLSSKTGVGMDEWIALITSRRNSRSASVPLSPA